MSHRFPLAAASFCLLAACTLKVGDVGELTADSSSVDPSADTGDSATDASGEPVTTTSQLSGDTEPADTDPGDTEPGDTTAGDSTTGGLSPASAVDILFVIDNSGSMAEEQQRLISAISELVTPLTDAGLDLRIAVTTTDSGSPRCPGAVYTPEGGKFVTASCRAMVAEGQWTFNDEDFSAACLDACPHETLPFSATTIADDPNLKVRSWVEWDDGASNVDLPLEQTLRCMLPQGVAGCGFESPLESMYLALANSANPASNTNFGFLRDEADLLVVIVSDETDCSYNPEFKDIFISNKVFWNDPDDVAPTSSVCWRAGMACTGGPGTYDDCVATDFDDEGFVTVDPALAVLQPLSRYQELLATIQADKLAAGSAGRVHVAAIAGVPIGYPQIPLVHADAVDPLIQANFGVGPGCEGGNTIAVPPGRIREIVEQTSPLGPGLFSICEPSFDGSMAAMAAGLTAD